MSREAMTKALEALEFIPESGSMLGAQAETKRLGAITALREELATEALERMAENARELGLDYEPVPENFMDALKFDVAMRDAMVANLVREGINKHKARELADHFIGLTSPPAQQEPVAKYIGEGSEGSLVQLYEDVKKGTDFYTSPPERTWVGLTDDEREIASWTDGSFGAGARWADAKLMEKNT